MIYTYTKKDIKKIIRTFIDGYRDSDPSMYKSLRKLRGSLTADEWDHLIYISERNRTSKNMKLNRFKIVLFELKKIAINHNVPSYVIEYWPNHFQLITTITEIEISETNDIRRLWNNILF